MKEKKRSMTETNDSSPEQNILNYSGSKLERALRLKQAIET